MKTRLCTDQIATLRIILERLNGMEFIVLRVFMDYEKAFDSLHRETLWNLTRYFGLPLS